MTPLVTSRMVDGVGIISFRRGAVRDECEILKTLESLTTYVASRAQLRILLDLEKLEFLTSTGLGRFVRLLKAARATKGTLILCSLRPFVREVFDTVGLSGLFEIQPTVDAALERFEKDLETEQAV